MERVCYISKNLVCEPYEYLPLDENAHEIRLLTLFPGEFGTNLCVNLSNVSFPPGAALNFEALSYAWGSQRRLSHVSVGLRHQRLRVTQNLVDALHHLRYPDTPRTLWVDAICVNQADLPERGLQVKRMADIYTKAARVIVWLGIGTPQSAKAVQIISSIGSRVNANIRTRSIQSSRIPPILSPDEQYLEQCADLSTVFNFDEIQTRCLADILGRSWFERLWIWQEIRLASVQSIVQCGQEIVPWHYFRTAVFLLYAKSLYTPASLELNDHHFLRERIKIAFRVCDDSFAGPGALFLHSQSAKCLDERDRVYALLSLFAARGIHLHVQPDYTKSVFEIYKEVTLQMLLEFSDLMILTTVELQEQEQGHKLKDSWISWVPDWSRPRLTSALPLNYAPSLSAAELFHQNGVLHVAGVAAAEIGSVCTFDPPGCVSHISKPSYADLENYLFKVIDHFYPEKVLDCAEFRSLCRAILAGGFADRFVPQRSHSRITWTDARKVLQDLVDSRMTGAPSSKLWWEVMTDTERLFWDNIAHFWTGRLVFQTESGALGLAPRAVRENDIVVVLLGCRSPLILRPIGSQFLIVGEAYCDRLISGEALVGALPEDWEAVFREDAEGTAVYWAYRNMVTGEIEVEDPRLAMVDLPPGWTKHKHELMHAQNLYVNSDSGSKPTDKDPRLTASAMRERGVEAKNFEIV